MSVTQSQGMPRSSQTGNPLTTLGTHLQALGFAAAGYAMCRPRAILVLPPEEWREDHRVRAWGISLMERNAEEEMWNGREGQTRMRNKNSTSNLKGRKIQEIARTTRYWHGKSKVRPP
jgi:hypothetical protein